MIIMVILSKLLLHKSDDDNIANVFHVLYKYTTCRFTNKHNVVFSPQPSLVSAT